MTAFRTFLVTLLALLSAAPTFAAEPAAPPGPAILHLETADEALAEDAGEFARTMNLDSAEALRRLRAQEGSVAATDALRTEFADRLAGLSIQHEPDYRIVVLLTGDQPVRDRFISAGGSVIPVEFRTGAVATYEQLFAALRKNQASIRQAFPKAQGLGVDPRTGSIVVLLRMSATDPFDRAQMEDRLSFIAGVPVIIRDLDVRDENFVIEGGARLIGVDPRDGKKYACTTGFVVTNNGQTGVLTAAHCPDELTYYSPDGKTVPLTMIGAWGAVYQDVQIHTTTERQDPAFYVDRAEKEARPLLASRARASTRAGDVVCHRGNSSGYSCSIVDLVDYAPPGDLCAGPCEPVWVSVAGPNCRGGDSGGPIFLGTTAFGIVKGGSYNADGACNFYYYMSLDYLPEGWSPLFDRGTPQGTAITSGSRRTSGAAR